MDTVKKIFLAEDDADDRELFAIFLKERPDIGDIIALESGIELLVMLKSLNEKDLPHLIILDQNMPRMTGLSTLEQLKGDHRLMRIPVMIYSTYTSDLLVEESLQKGAVYVSPKPDNKAGYERMIDDFLLKLEE